MQEDKGVILFDGVCNLCNGAINFIIDRDPKSHFKFASLQSEQARMLMPEEPLDKELKTIILIRKDGKVFKQSDAILEISKHLSGGWPVLTVFKIIPRFIRDGVYSFISNNRYRFFGKKDQCRIPTPELKERFLDAY